MKKISSLPTEITFTLISFRSLVFPRLLYYKESEMSTRKPTFCEKNVDLLCPERVNTILTNNRKTYCNICPIVI